MATNKWATNMRAGAPPHHRVAFPLPPCLNACLVQCACNDWCNAQHACATCKLGIRPGGRREKPPHRRRHQLEGIFEAPDRVMIRPESISTMVCIFDVFLPVFLFKQLRFCVLYKRAKRNLLSCIIHDCCQMSLERRWGPRALEGSLVRTQPRQGAHQLSTVAKSTTSPPFSSPKQI
jgi:hypothetical protein